MINDEINRFCDYFEQQIQNIAQLENVLYSRILWVTLLDTLSIAGHPKLVTKNHNRIIKFIDIYVQWADKDRASLPQIELQLRTSNLTDGKLYKHVISRIEKWPHGPILYPDTDPQLDEIIHLANCNCERKIINECSYKELFYINRNYLVHEFRDPGYGFLCLSSSNNAFYHEHDSRWELVFPTILFKSFCSEGLTKLKKELEKNNRNPYDAYKFSSNWRLANDKNG
jgi:hypothetical protein